jgi:hypothetical protein
VKSTSFDFGDGKCHCVHLIVFGLGKHIETTFEMKGKCARSYTWITQLYDLDIRIKSTDDNTNSWVPFDTIKGSD